jgi:hypothetical protein
LASKRSRKTSVEDFFKLNNKIAAQTHEGAIVVEPTSDLTRFGLLKLCHLYSNRTSTTFSLFKWLNEERKANEHPKQIGSIKLSRVFRNIQAREVLN